MNTGQKQLLVALFTLSMLCSIVSAQIIKFPAQQVKGQGPLPYNYRIIDQTIHVGGHPLNPRTTFHNSDKQVLSILNYLKSKKVTTIIDLEKTWWIQQRYNKLLHQAGVKRIHIHMHAFKVPNKKEWQRIKAAMKKPVYVHCKWGADRAGAVVGRYLVEEKGIIPKKAYQAVISKGSHAGVWGGLKTSQAYARLKKFIYSGP